MSMGQGMGNWHAIRSFTQDRSVAKQKLAKGTVNRIARFAKPYRKLIAILLGFLSIDAAIGIVNPLLYREIINRGILLKDSGLVIGLALVVGAIAVFDAGLMLADRYGAHLVREPVEERVGAARRKAMMLCFARAAALRLQLHLDPGCGFDI